jgi:hypothetical protein
MRRLKKNLEIRLSQKSKGPWKRFKTGSHFQYVAYYEEVEIGNISVFKNGVRVYVSTVFIKTNYRGNGFGYQLYDFELKKHGCLSTDILYPAAHCNMHHIL